MSSHRLVLDAREPKGFLELFDGLDPKPQVETLDIGDARIVATSDDAPAIVFERKTWEDFSSSIKSKRLVDQTQRTVAFCRSTNSRPVLLLETPTVRGWTTKEDKFLDCCLHKYSLEGYSVVRTRDKRHTFDVLSWMLKRCREGKVPEFQSTLSFRGEASDVCFKKSANLTREKTWINMLTAVRGVSIARAKDISKRYSNARKLIERFESHRGLDVAGVGKKTEATLRAVFMD